MTLDEIKTAVRAGKRVHWINARYVVQFHLSRRTGAEQWLFVCDNGSCAGLTHADGTMLSSPAEEFFTAEGEYSAVYHRTMREAIAYGKRHYRETATRFGDVPEQQVLSANGGKS